MPIDKLNSAPFGPEQLPAASYTVWAPFDESTTYFEPSRIGYMFDFVVADLDGASAQANEGGTETVGDNKECNFGRFGWLLDSEGNKVELAEPRNV